MPSIKVLLKTGLIAIAAIALAKQVPVVKDYI